MKKALSLILVGFALAVTMVECKKEPNIVGISPTYAFPLLDARLSIGDVIGARPNEVLSEYEFGSGSDSTYFFKLVYTDTLEPLTLLQFQDSLGSFDFPVTIELPERNMYLRMLGKSKDGSFQFLNPEVEFVFDNYTNMEYELAFDTIYTLNVQNQNKYYFNLQDGFIPVAAGDITAGGTTEYVITNENTNPTGALTVVFEPTPKYLYYQPILTSKGGTGITGDRVDIFAKVVLPFEGKGKVGYRDTIAYGFEQDLLTEVIDFAFLRLNFENGIPLQASMKGYIVDTTTFDTIGPLPLYEATTGDFRDNDVLIPGAIQNNLNPTSNPTTESAQLTTDVRIYKENPITRDDDIEMFAKGNAVVIELEFNTSGFDDDEFVKIFSSQYMKLNLGIKTRIGGEINLDSLNEAVRDSLGLPSFP